MRRQETITIPGVRSDNFGERDNGKTFVLREMAADQGERWATRALLALTNAGVEIPDGAAEMGWGGLAAAGLQALSKIHFSDLEPLLDEMWKCVRYEHAPNLPPQAIIEGETSQIQEIMTRVPLRKEVLRLQLNFCVAADPPKTAGPPVRGARVG